MDQLNNHKGVFCDFYQPLVVVHGNCSNVDLLLAV